MTSDYNSENKKQTRRYREQSSAYQRGKGQYRGGGLSGTNYYVSNKLQGYMYSIWTVACQDLLPMEFSRHEYWSGLPFPSPGDLPEPGTEPASPALTSGFFTAEPRAKLRSCIDNCQNMEANQMSFSR